MEYTATAKYIRVSTRKVRLLADSIRGLRPYDSIAKLVQMKKSAAKPLVNVINAALANIKEKQTDKEKLTFQKIEIMGGPAIKRWHAVSKGSGHGYKKRMTHIRIEITDQDKNIKE